MKKVDALHSRVVAQNYNDNSIDSICLLSVIELVQPKAL